MIISSLCEINGIITVCRRSCGKVMFYTCLSVILFMVVGGVSASVHAGIHPTMLTVGILLESILVFLLIPHTSLKLGLDLQLCDS